MLCGRRLSYRWEANTTIYTSYVLFHCCNTLFHLERAFTTCFGLYDHLQVFGVQSLKKNSILSAIIVGFFCMCVSFGGCLLPSCCTLPQDHGAAPRIK
jgi:hypothetical protein